MSVISGSNLLFQAGSIPKHQLRRDLETIPTAQMAISTREALKSPVTLIPQSITDTQKLRSDLNEVLSLSENAFLTKNWQATAALLVAELRKPESEIGAALIMYATNAPGLFHVRIADTTKIDEKGLDQFNSWRNVPGYANRHIDTDALLENKLAYATKAVEIASRDLDSSATERSDKEIIGKLLARLDDIRYLSMVTRPLESPKPATSHTSVRSLSV